MRQRGLTLIEILVATAIFLLMGGVMLGVFSTATEIYRRGESSRVAMDEAMAVISTLDRDISAALHPNLGGHFWAQHQSNGNCIIAWTIHDYEDPTGESLYAVIAWRMQGGALRRARWSEVDPQDPDTWPSDDQIRGFANSTQSDTVSEGVLLFHTALFGTGPQDANPQVPADRQWVLLGNGQEVEPSPGSDPYFSLHNMHYPQGIRISLLMAGSSRFALNARVLSDDGQGRLRIAGATGLPSVAGSLCRIGNEVIAFHGIDSMGSLRINDSSNGSQGTWNGNPNPPANQPLGRAVFGSSDPPADGHNRGTEVRFGNPFVITRILPGRPR